MHIDIVIDTREELSDQDRAILSAIAAHPSNGSVKAADPVAAPEPEEKPAHKRRGRPRKVETVEEPKAVEPEKPAEPEEAEPETEETEDEGTPAVLEEDGDAPTLEQAVARATALISDGKAQAVKGVLTSLGVKKVGELPSDKIQDFLDDLENV